MVASVAASSALVVSLAVVSPAIGGAATSAHGPVQSGKGGTQAGGTITFGTGEELTALDPASATEEGGLDGGDAMAAVFGVLMRLNPQTGQYVPQLARSLTSSNDYQTWTLKLRPNVVFSDGTPFNAQAVVENINRDLDPSLFAVAAQSLEDISSMTTPDPLTVVFQLKRSVVDFPFALAFNGGFIAAPSYLAELKNGEKTATAIGAGPFVVKSFVPGQGLQLTRNPRYWAGPVPLDGLNFEYISGGTGTLQAYQSGEYQAGVLSDPSAVQEAVRDGIPHLTTLFLLSQTIIMNGQPMNQPGGSIMSNPELRRAITMAISPKIYNQRVNNGTGNASNLLFPKGSQWYFPSEKGISYNPTKAKAIVKQVEEKTGWNGDLNYICSNDPDEVDSPVAVQAMLQPIGIHVNSKLYDPNGFITAMYIKRAFDIACDNAGVDDSILWPALNPVIYYPANGNNAHYDSPAMNAALDQLRVATTHAESEAAVREIVDVWNAGPPMVPIAANDAVVIHSPKVHGLIPTMNAGVLFNKAWVSG